MKGVNLTAAILNIILYRGLIGLAHYKGSGSSVYLVLYFGAYSGAF